MSILQVCRAPRVSIFLILTDILCSVKGTHAQIVPVYAYDQRFPNVLYVRDNDSEKRKGYGQATQDNGRPSEVYQFARFQGGPRLPRSSYRT